MPSFGPIKRKDLIRYLRHFGFEGPFTGGRHQYMVKGTLKLRIPNPHHADIAGDLLSRILRQAGIDKEDWEKL
ncbi:MAG: type II toxin-antitoxin system HicA family toxin [Anaerolineae bacterium]|nr:type II toxin-antitoxin system HicA family toxin [Anaerolineae bacterium]